MGGISIHAPHARSDDKDGPRGAAVPSFQSTLLMRGATTMARAGTKPTCNFNPRSSCEERRRRRRGARHLTLISIHAPHARSDVEYGLIGKWYAISIHAPHARSDVPLRSMIFTSRISIHAPHARSDFLSVGWEGLMIKFQSTLLMRGAT